MTAKAYTIKRPGRPPGEAARARLAAPACEKCRNLHVDVMGVRGPTPYCTFARTDFNAAACPDYDDVSRDKPRMVGGVSGRKVAA